MIQNDRADCKQAVALDIPYVDCGMASFFFSSKRASEQKRNSGASFVFSPRPRPNVSTRSVLESESSSSRHLLSSSLISSYEECSKNESFDLLPKTDYTYARSGSYSPRHLKKSYVNPNMSRRRLRGVVTPPVSMLDSDSDLDMFDQINYEENRTHFDATDSFDYTHSNANAGIVYHTSYGGHQTDQLDFDSDSADLDDQEVILAGNVRFKDKQRADEENMRIRRSQLLEDTQYRHYYEGMVLRSGSHLKGSKRLRDLKESDVRKSTSVIDNSLATFSSNAINAHGTSLTRRSDSGQLTQSDHPAYDTGYSTTTTTTTVTKTVTEMEEEELNKNNNARSRYPTRSPARKAGRGGTGQIVEIELDRENERKRLKDEHQQEKSHRFTHMYGLDYDDFSDSDSYTSSSYTSSGDYAMAGRSQRYGYAARSAFFVITVVTTIVETINSTMQPVTRPLWTSMIRPTYMYGNKCSKLMWERLTRVARSFILLDAWLLSRNTRRGCCLCLPLLFLLPLLLGGGHYVSQILPAKSSFLAFPAYFFSQQHTTHIHQGDTVHTVNLHHEVKQIMQQLQSGSRDWLTKAEIEALVQSMLHPEMESLRISILNIGKEGNSDQAALKVDQHDAKLQVAALEEQFAALQAKAKIFEKDLSDSRAHFMGTLAGDKNRQAESLGAMEAALADLRAQLGSLQSSYMGLLAHSRTCCINDTNLVAAIRTNVNEIIAEMFANDGQRKDGGGSGFAGWLNQNYVDRKEFERQLRLLTVDITDRITAGIEAQRSGHSSPLVLPTGANTLSEDAVKLIVEDALLRYSADRTGLPDYALESAGGSVISVRCSETYYRKTALISVFGFPLWYISNSPRTVIQPEVHPGQCWAFKGQSGYIVIQLAVPIRPTGFSLEHIPKSLSMTGNIDSAPKEFTVFGLHSETDTNGVNLGNFTYQVVGKPIQHFDVQIGNPGVFTFVELRVLNNHGNKEYTCLYRFRVHGVPQL